MWFTLLLLSWSVEIVLGGWFVYYFWTVKAWTVGDITEFGLGYDVLFVYHSLTQSLRHPYLITQVQIAYFALIVYAAFHVLAIARGLAFPGRERLRLGVRMQPSIREVERFDRAFAQLARGRLTIPEAPQLKKPRWWAVRDGHGLQIRWVGWVLVIDRDLLVSKHFPALFAHQLGHSHSFDLLTRTLWNIFPSLRWAPLTFFGLPNACGRILFYPFWMKYWRDRVFACDEYAARLGQRHQLIRALDTLNWTMEGHTATPGGRWFHETPYLESRIDRLMRYQAPLTRTSSRA